MTRDAKVPWELRLMASLRRWWRQLKQRREDRRRRKRKWLSLSDMGVIFEELPTGEWTDVEILYRPGEKPTVYINGAYRPTPDLPQQKASP